MTPNSNESSSLGNSNNHNNVRTSSSQILVRFENHRTLVIQLEKHSTTAPSSAEEAAKLFIKQQVVRELLQLPQQGVVDVDPRWNWEHCLEISHYDPPYCNCRVQSQLLGGKGGFGTLLKGQSRQASAQTTRDFSACRDLQGRRLRHVNDALQYAVWKEWNEKVQNGTATMEEMAAALIHNNNSNNKWSGIAGWHLPLPAWSEVSSKKEQQRQKKLLHQWQKERERKKLNQQDQRELVERQVAAYMQSAETATAQLESTLSAALQQGLQKQQQQQATVAKRLKTESHHDEPLPPPVPVSLLTLSGDAVIFPHRDDNGVSDKWRIQGQSNFCTVGIVLDQNKMARISSRIDSSSNSNFSPPVLYWEMVLITAGLVQIGWATGSFRPDSDRGEGVGDCAHSWGYDGSRSIKLHHRSSETMTVPPPPTDSTPFGGGQSWKVGDVVGCRYNVTTGEISYGLNCNDLGVAFSSAVPTVFPAISCNLGEIVELRLNAGEFSHQPAGSVPVGDVMATEDVNVESLRDDDGNDDDEADSEEMDGKLKVVQNESVHRGRQKEASDVNESSSAVTKQAALVIAEPLDLEKYESAKELEELGLNRLKGALMAIGLKCGGTLQERAVRLFSVRNMQPEMYPRGLLAKK